MEKGGWVARLWFYVANRKREEYVEVYNQSISGGTTETILSRLESEATIREADALIFQTGGNDASYEHAPERHMVPIEKFRANIEEIIIRAKKITKNIVFLDLKNCDESKTMPVSWIDIYYTNANIQKYSEAMKEVCEKHGVLFLNIAPLENEDFEDGLHPNAAGHQKIFEQVKIFLEAQGWV